MPFFKTKIEKCTFERGLDCCKRFLLHYLPLSSSNNVVSKPRTPGAYIHGSSAYNKPNNIALVLFLILRDITFQEIFVVPQTFL